jgi:hypothetical protein
LPHAFRGLNEELQMNPDRVRLARIETPAGDHALSHSLSRERFGIGRPYGRSTRVLTRTLNVAGYKEKREMARQSGLRIPIEPIGECVAFGLHVGDSS